MRTRPASLAAIGCLAAALAWLAPIHVAPLRTADTWLDDLRVAYLSPPVPVSPHVVVLAIDEDTLRTFPFRSPVNRRFVASLLRTLADRNVAAVGLDLIFDQPTVPADDEALAQVIAEFPAPVVIATGSAINGLTPAQLEFQSRYLAGQRTGSAALLTTDGVVRHITPGEVADGELAPSFAAALAASVGLPVPTEPVLLAYRVRGERGSAPIRTFAAQRLPVLPATWFEGQVVIIGADLPNQDRYMTPLSVLGGEFAMLPGAQIHAQALAQLFEETSYPLVAVWARAAILIAAIGLGLVLPFLNVHITLKSVLGAALLGAYWFLGFFEYARSAALLPLMTPTLGFLLSASFASAYGRYAARREQKFVREAFGHYVSSAVIEQILADPSKLSLRGEQRDMSYVFTDLAGFTRLTESLEATAVVALLQAYFEGLLELVLEFDGTIDRLVGDGANVIFGAPTKQPDHAQRAVRCALACDRYCETFREAQIAKGIAFGVTRIGVHTGTGIAGNVGSARRFQYTAHGDAVNIAARLESANKVFGTRVCISAAAAAAACCPDLTFRPVGHIVVRGKSRGLDCVTPADGLASELVRTYDHAYALMQKRDSSAIETLELMRQRYPTDALIAFHLERLKRGETGTTIVME